MFTTAELFGQFHSPKAPLPQARPQAAAAAPQELERLFQSCLPAGLLSQAQKGDNIKFMNSAPIPGVGTDFPGSLPQLTAQPDSL
jgi:hypothetical protein